MDKIDWDLISSYAGLLSLASISVYAGAYGSLTKPPKKSTDSSKSLLEDDDGDDEDIPDRMSSGDAWLFPFIGSAALFGMYTIVKYFGKEWINWLLGWYFTIAGVGSVWKSVISLARLAIGSTRWKKFDRNRLLVLKGPRELVSFSLRTPSLCLFPVGILPSILYSQYKSALLTDILSLSFSHNALSVLKIDSFQTGCILLSGLFFYDIYWVFGTEVMVKVATSLDIPIKLLWPKSLEFSTARGFTMLGLGDIVIPGTFVALALRYDYARSLKSGSQIHQSFPKPYFSATLSAYVTGLVTTMTVMHVFGAAQPALLYLSPACIFAFLLTAVARGEFKEAWTWSDDPEHSQEGKEGKKADGTPAPIEVDAKNNVTPNLDGHVKDHVNGVAVVSEDELVEPAEVGDEPQTAKKRKNKKKAQ
ncbi:signal peptide peptidase-domain-containing protein [Hygrophoropsis aurantiaca]|uniref:Signal peptide peptidase-domain-containing protein n=1 Tax=Hygrophoropsis aurantiaca TaxID=72124 RepID=A0ACB8ALK6_9AGAM|nr:signal peptide peptidase-domain-containing protein [Hygrophoropsis aurantiaca]